jgi:hypothetical protein
MDLKTKLTLFALPSALLVSTASFARAELIDCLDDCVHAEYDCEDDAMQIEDPQEAVDAYNQCADEEHDCSDACWDQY